jgi:hypothetical protein
MLSDDAGDTVNRIPLRLYERFRQLPRDRRLTFGKLKHFGRPPVPMKLSGCSIRLPLVQSRSRSLEEVYPEPFSRCRYKSEVARFYGAIRLAWAATFCQRPPRLR